MRFDRISPVFPVRSIELHLAQVDNLKPRRNTRAVYLNVDDADALYREWSQAGIGGRLVEPTDTSYGLREGACLDRDANLIRFGSLTSSGDNTRGKVRGVRTSGMPRCAPPPSPPGR